MGVGGVVAGPEDVGGSVVVLWAVCRKTGKCLIRNFRYKACDRIIIYVVMRPASEIILFGTDKVLRGLQTSFGYISR